MQIKLKRAYEAPAQEDGLRILVDRLWPRGISKEKAKIDLWLKEIAPSTDLRKWFGHDPQRWEEFRRRYHAELAANPEAVGELKKAARDQAAITLVYGARDETHNDAVALLEYLQADVFKQT